MRGRRCVWLHRYMCRLWVRRPHPFILTRSDVITMRLFLSMGLPLSRVCHAIPKSSAYELNSLARNGRSFLTSWSWTRKKPKKDKEPQELTAVPIPRDTSAEEGLLHKFIPVTRRTLLRKLLEDKDLIKSVDKQLMESIAASLDAKFSQGFYNILEEAKFLYDGMDPDKDTHQARELSRKEVLDNEYHLLQKLGKLLDKANFHKIPRERLHSMLKDRNTRGIIVSVDLSQYELLQIWTRGQKLKEQSGYKRVKDSVMSLLRPQSVKEREMTYPRVFVAVRTHKEKKLHLKVFKDVSTTDLEHLLPRGKLKMSDFDKYSILTTVLIGACLPLVRMLLDFKIQWVWGGMGVALVVAARAWSGYKSKRNYYLANLATTLYFKTIANNRGVLTLLTDRAQDEEFKEALLAYSFLLCPQKSKADDVLIYDTPESLTLRIESWLQKQFHLKDFNFDIDDALNKLDNLGLLVKRRNGSLTVLSVVDALEVLPSPGGRWLAVGVRRDSESLDEQMDTPKQLRAASGWG